MGWGNMIFGSRSVLEELAHRVNDTKAGNFLIITTDCGQIYVCKKETYDCCLKTLGRYHRTLVAVNKKVKQNDSKTRNRKTKKTIGKCR